MSQWDALCTHYSIGSCITASDKPVNDCLKQ